MKAAATALLIAIVVVVMIAATVIQQSRCAADEVLVQGVFGPACVKGHQ